jgi:hypothetical protein
MTSAGASPCASCHTISVGRHPGILSCGRTGSIEREKSVDVVVDDVGRGGVDDQLVEAHQEGMALDRRHTGGTIASDQPAPRCGLTAFTKLTFHFPLLWRLYLRSATVRRLNRRRKHNKLRYHSKLDLTQQMLQQILPSLPKGHPVYVLFDSWYTSAKLVKWIRQQGWHVIAAVKSNRKVSGQKLTQWHNDHKGCSHGRVSLELAQGRKRTYWVRSFVGRLRGVPGSVRVVMSQRGPGVRAPRYFLCTDLTLYAQEILRRYQHRWSQEADYWYVKQELGLGDFQLQSYEAIERWYALVYLVLVYLYWRSYEARDAAGHTPSLSEMMAGIRHDHQREVLRAACAEAAAGTPVEAVLERYLGSARPQAA